MCSKVLFLFFIHVLVYNFALSATLNVIFNEAEKTNNTIIKPIRKDFYTYYELQNHANISNNSPDSVNDISNSSVSVGLNNTLDYDGIKNDTRWCDCGNNSVDCKYVNGFKICYCEKGYLPKYVSDTYCEKCDCGPHAKACKFILNQKKCKCQEGYTEFKEQCLRPECDCGPHTKSCEFVMNQKKCKCQEGYTEFKEQCLRPECDCGPNSVFCSLDNNKKKQCFCKDGYDVENYIYSKDYMMCKRCDCGIGASSCKFDFLGSRKCECKSGYSKKKKRLEVDERCEKCDCGPNSISCRYEDNYRKCNCATGYEARAVQFDESCYKKCDCGPHTKSCELVMGQKKCKCQEGYTEFKEKCLRPECDCGPNSVFCSLDNNKKKQCFCKDGYDVDNSVYPVDMMCKRCDCGIGASSCKFDFIGFKKCECKSGYSKKKNLWDEKCEKCDCGEYSTSCSFSYLGMKECTCMKEAVFVYGDTCQLKCDCGPNSISCRYQNNYKKCNCETGYEARTILSDEYCYKKITSVSGWKIATYILIAIFCIIFVIQIKIIRQHNERTRT